MDKLTIHPYSEDDSPLPQAERAAFARLLAAIFEEMPDNTSKWVACLSLGTANCAGLSVSDMAALARCSEERLIQGAVTFCSNIGIAASPHLRSAIKTRLASGQLTVKGQSA